MTLHILYIFIPDGMDSEIPFAVGVYEERAAAIRVAWGICHKSDYHYVVFPLKLNQLRDPILEWKGTVWDSSKWDPDE